jgi:hypothetical protein
VTGSRRQIVFKDQGFNQCFNPDHYGWKPMLQWPSRLSSDLQSHPGGYRLFGVLSRTRKIFAICRDYRSECKTFSTNCFCHFGVRSRIGRKAPVQNGHWHE